MATATAANLSQLRSDELEEDAGPRPAPPYEICYRSRVNGASLTIAQSTDADEATIAFHAVLAEWDGGTHDGDLLLIRYEPSPKIMLRQPLSNGAVHHSSD